MPSAVYVREARCISLGLLYQGKASFTAAVYTFSDIQKPESDSSTECFIPCRECSPKRGVARLIEPKFFSLG